MAQLREGSVIKKSTGDEVIATVNDIPEIPTSLPADGGNADTVGGFTVGVNVPANAKFTDTIYTHPAGTNPHGTTKSDIGLGSVSNYGVATKTEAETGASNTKYMTPLRVKEAISSSPMYHVGTTPPTNNNLLWINTNL